MVSEHSGQEALDYAAAHLSEVRQLDGGFRVELVCPDYDKGWLLDYVGPTPHGGPTASQVRLRTLDEVRRATLSAIRDVDVLSDDEECATVADRLSTLLQVQANPPRG